MGRQLWHVRGEERQLSGSLSACLQSLQAAPAMSSWSCKLLVLTIHEDFGPSSKGLGVGHAGFHGVCRGQAGRGGGGEAGGRRDGMPAWHGTWDATMAEQQACPPWLFCLRVAAHGPPPPPLPVLFAPSRMAPRNSKMEATTTACQYLSALADTDVPNAASGRRGAAAGRDGLPDDGGGRKEHARAPRLPLPLECTRSFLASPFARSFAPMPAAKGERKGGGGELGMAFGAGINDMHTLTYISMY